MNTNKGNNFKQVDINGSKVQYVDFGGGDKTLVMVHGFPGRPQDFRWLNDSLKNHFRVIQICLPGMGYTPLKASPAVSLEQRSAFLIAFLECLQIDKCWLLGHSINGALSIVSAAKSPERIDRLILLCSIGLRPHKSYRHLPPKGVFLFSQLPGIRKLFMPSIRKAYTSIGFPQGITDESIIHSLRCLYAVDYSIIRKHVDLLQCSTMSVWTKTDPLIEHEVQAELASRLPSGPRLIFEQGGHNPQRTHVKEIVEGLTAWSHT